ncbi:heterocyst frequency control protein PatD [Thermocoleostomius sinensis]|uniref:Heterocyst frequency control protein PatD n=1 Tax=Thermocoleostomius sinensis A174 TaxID=2016057 RepID=A0A9E8ZBH8_9CYAN|nr:heterocyst frequency control protein PatD [Thermocoleostomius sinensis]WAL60174.1 heterocyst frequency control protein PatD [Thermocoleostomius sinensis A174]
MVLDAQRRSYFNFQRDLLQLQDILQKRVSGTVLQSAFQDLQQSWQSLLEMDVSQNEGQLAQGLTANVQTYQTEMSRLMRLLGMDILFLKAARQSATTQQRLQQASDRVAQLLQYCEGILGMENEA